MILCRSPRVMNKLRRVQEKEKDSAGRTKGLELRGTGRSSCERGERPKVSMGATLNKAVKGLKANTQVIVGGYDITTHITG